MAGWIDANGNPRPGRIVRDLFIGAVFVTTLVMAGCPKYNVWQQGLAGQAELKRAEQNRQIAIQEAKAVQEGAVFRAQAEIERAKGVAEANRIVADSLKDHEEYLRYLSIQAYHDIANSPNSATIIYVPTEAGIPVTEAKRLK